MESIKLEPGWLARQMREVREEVLRWPEVLVPLTTLNASLVHRSNTPEVSNDQPMKPAGSAEVHG